MNSLGARLFAFYRRLPPATIPLIIIVLAVLLGNIMYVSGLANNDPISWSAGISHQLCRVTCGRPMIDPNVGYITQPFGHLAATDLLHGHLPFWNYNAGLGEPLAGEMQGASLFPLTLLFALSSGLVWFHVALEVIAGVSTYFLAKRLSLPTVIATGAGIIFALNGTFAWLGNAVLNPVCFLPMLLLGIEMIYDSARNRTRAGWFVAALALALSIYAGFPEVAYLDGLFCAGWAIVRFFSLPKEVRLVGARRIGLAGLVGTFLALPILVPFLDFVKVANVGSHLVPTEGSVYLSPANWRMLIDPYIYGTIFSNHTPHNAGAAWGSVGGYVSVGVFALALLGLFGKRLRALRIYMGVWITLGILDAFAALHVRTIWNLIPVIDRVAVSRYIFPSVELATVVLAALGIVDLATSTRARRLFWSTTAIALALLLWSALSAGAINNGVTLAPRAGVIFWGLHAIPFLSIGFLLILGIFSKKRVTPILITVLLVGESLLLFFVPTAEAPKQITIDQAPITFLQTHQGNYRFLDLGVLYPNWGTQFGINEIGVVDLPFPNEYAKFIERSLFPGLTPVNQFTIHGGIAGIRLQENMVLNHLAAYEGASVKYLLFNSSVPILPALTKLGVTKVFSDSLATIYQLPAPRPYFSTTSKTCALTTTSVDSASLSCPSGGATLVRTELAMAGWHAYVNGKEVKITTRDGVYQTIQVPSGTSKVTYSFMPPHEKYAILAGLLAVLLFLGSWGRERWILFRRREQTSE